MLFRSLQVLELHGLAQTVGLGDTETDRAEGRSEVGHVERCGVGSAGESSVLKQQSDGVETDNVYVCVTFVKGKRIELKGIFVRSVVCIAFALTDNRQTNNKQTQTQ